MEMVAAVKKQLRDGTKLEVDADGRRIVLRYPSHGCHRGRPSYREVWVSRLLEDLVFVEFGILGAGARAYDAEDDAALEISAYLEGWAVPVVRCLEVA